MNAQTKPRVVEPPLAALHALRPPLNDGERRVLDWFLEILPIDWEIYIQPHLNGLRPDFVLMHPQRGIAVYEVKDWNLHGLDYFVQGTDRQARLMGYKEGKEFCLARQDPVAAIDRYKQEIHGLYVPSLAAKSGYGAIVAGVIFTSASTQSAEDLLHPRAKQKRTLTTRSSIRSSGPSWLASAMCGRYDCFSPPPGKTTIA